MSRQSRAQDQKDQGEKHQTNEKRGRLHTLHQALPKLANGPVPGLVDSSRLESNRLESNSVEIEPSSASLARHSGRMIFIAVCFFLLTCLILVRLLSHQLINWGATGFNNLIAKPPAPRGVIVDRDGELLAVDHFTYQLLATPSLIADEEDRTTIARLLQELTGVAGAKIQQLLFENAEASYLVLEKTLSVEAGQRLNDWRRQNPDEAEVLAPIYLQPNPQRYYPQGALASQLLGFVNVDVDRKAHYGVEEYYDLFLREDGVGLTERSNDTLEMLSYDVRRFVPSAVSKDLVLTIDRTIQWIIEEELREAVSFYRAESGTIIVMNPDTGAVYGLANWPTYDPNTYSDANINDFDNPAVSLQYEPGSIFKVITMAAALDTDVITPTMTFTDTGAITVGGRIILNSNRSAVGRISATGAFARSLNVVTAEIATMIGAEDFYRYLRRFGFGSATEIDLAKEVAGLIKTPKSADWSLSELGTNSFGQGLAVTPIQMISAVASIANGGRLMRPHVVETRIYDEKIQTLQPTVVRNTMTPKTAAELTEMMVQVVEVGNREARVPGYRIAGKSGTAQIPIKGGYSEDETIVSFVGFAPAENPAFVMLVKLDRPDPDISPWAAYTAAPTFSRVARRLLEHLDIPPDGTRTAVVDVSN